MITLDENSRVGRLTGRTLPSVRIPGTLMPIRPSYCHRALTKVKSVFILNRMQ